MEEHNKDIVASQYEKWVYPEPVKDLAEERAKGRADATSVRMVHLMYWPDGSYLKRYNKKLDILIAGCGANAAARFAYEHPRSTVTGIDLSTASLKHEEFLKEKHGLTNLTLHQMRIESVSELGQEFDFIESSGVLHHLPDPQAGLASLKSVLKPDGVMALMLYGLYGRAGTYMLQSLFHQLGFEQGDEDVQSVKQALQDLHPQHLAHHYIDNNSDMRFDAGIVDSFLHGMDRPYTVQDCLEFVEHGGMVFRGWINRYDYYPEGQIPESSPLFSRIQSLPEEDIWKVMELLHSQIRMHLFYVGKKEVLPESYIIDFDGPRFPDIIPHQRIHEFTAADPAADKPAMITRKPYPPVSLNESQTGIFHLFNGKNTVKEIVSNCGVRETEENLTLFIRNFLLSLWRMGHVYIQIPEV
ncbi:SAM-dependent methyltransferase [Candidatus Scalindua japonica]|uniref:SAM-dependent methyltransferase n=1 Tax=Candidatus Scalindua japonica TaxID=1284222 RepID=A0A286TY76_9BACT|nr:class I SAM-dependent methyltransferase [Candidatus Scalindua japonica]GAX60845.1 SAM-dependent methyltransferase [Candidatus Scalindua japonica]